MSKSLARRCKEINRMKDETAWRNIFVKPGKLKD
ncbi:DUF3983 domain-containing protein [Bacillus sp. Bva_UNVM-123]